MRPAWQTTEFWVMLITNIVGVMALTGRVAPDQADALIKGLSAIAGALLMLGTSFGFIKARISMRISMLNVLAQTNCVSQTLESDAHAAASVRDVQLSSLLGAIREAGV